MTSNSRDNAQGQPIDEVGESIGLLEGIRTTRPFADKKPDPVPIELVKKVCEAGTFAPSGGNRQPWMFVAVTDPENAQIATLYREVFDAYIAPAVRPHKTWLPRSKTEKHAGRDVLGCASA